jgi:hypothetical protein
MAALDLGPDALKEWIEGDSIELTIRFDRYSEVHFMLGNNKLPNDTGAFHSSYERWKT